MQANGVLRLKEHRDLAVKGCIDLALRLRHSRATPHGTAGKGRVFDLRQSYQLAGKRTVQTQILHN